MKKSLKILLIITLIFVIIIVSILLINIFQSSDSRILNGYYKKDDYSESHAYRDYADYYKYYYTIENDSDFKSSSIYSKVRNIDIEELKSYFTKFRELMKASNRLENYDFDESIIDENDYFIINNKVDIGERISRKKFDYYQVFFYDMNSHILYVIQVNA